LVDPEESSLATTKKGTQEEKRNEGNK